MKIQRGQKREHPGFHLSAKGRKSKVFIGQRQAGNLKFFCQDSKDQAEGQRSSMLKVTRETFCILPNLININIVLSSQSEIANRTIYSDLCFIIAVAITEDNSL